MKMKKKELRNILKEEILNELHDGSGKRWFEKRPKRYNDNKYYYKIIGKVLQLFEEEQERSPEPEGDFFVYLRDMLNKWKPSSTTIPSDFDQEDSEQEDVEGDFDPDETDYSSLSDEMLESDSSFENHVEKMFSGMRK